MSKEIAEVPTVGIDGQLLPVMPPERDPRLSIRVIRVMFYVPGFTALLLLKTGEPTGFGITIEFLMLASVASVLLSLRSVEFVAPGSAAPRMNMPGLKSHDYQQSLSVAPGRAAGTISA